MTVPVWEALVVGLVVVLAVFGLYLRGLAGRLDRLHVRVEASRDALDAQLLRRAGAALELASSGVLDVASSFIVLEAATAAQDSGPDTRAEAESALSEDLRAVLDAPGAEETLQADPAGRERLAALGRTTERVVLARRFHNDAVRAARDLRRSTLVRAFHLAGRAALPESFEMDDAPPTAVSGITGGAT